MEGELTEDTGQALELLFDSSFEKAAKLAGASSDRPRPRTSPARR
jgi:hypothetical protein